MSSPEGPIINFHIPKTAGTTLRSTFVEQLGPENVALMMNDRRLIRVDDLPFSAEAIYKARKVARSLGMANVFSSGLNVVNRYAARKAFSVSELGSQDVALATGHFIADDITEEVAHLPKVTLIREPLQRMRSHYSHWRDKQGKIWWHDGSIPYSDDVSFEQFATDPAITNYHAKCMGDLAFAAIGSTGDIPAFLEQIGLEPGVDVPRLNSAPRQGGTDLDPGFVRDFTALNAQDYELFEVAQSPRGSV